METGPAAEPGGELRRTWDQIKVFFQSLLRRRDLQPSTSLRRGIWFAIWPHSALSICARCSLSE
jgi:hypothetical protein